MIIDTYLFPNFRAIFSTTINHRLIINHDKKVLLRKEMNNPFHTLFLNTWKNNYLYTPNASFCLY